MEPTEYEAARPEDDDVAYGRSVLRAELRAIEDLVPQLDRRFAEAVQMLTSCSGRVVVTGVGKSGLIGQKISATMASTGTPSLFLHSGEAVHGDMGRVLEQDIVLALSYSGTTDEVMRLVPIIKKIGAPLIAITSTADSALGSVADTCLPLGRIEEACPIGLAPTSSTTAMLALGDALAMTVAERKHFDRESFALFHRGGAIGRGLVTVGEVMRPLDRLACVRPGTPVSEALQAQAAAAWPRSGAVLVTDDQGLLLGIFAGGDLRRGLLGDPGLLTRPIEQVMTGEPKVARATDLLADAYNRVKEHKIDELPVVDGTGHAVGVLDVQDVVEWGVAL